MANYHKGRRFEYQIAEILRQNGFEVIRAAGSHGLYDLVATKRTGKNVYEIGMLQLKATRTGGALREVVHAEP